MQKLSRRQTLATLLAAGAQMTSPSLVSGETRGPHLTFLLVNDIYRCEDFHGRGGLARFAAVVKAERARAEAEGGLLICAHAGDTFSPSLLSSFDQGAHMVALFNDIGLDAFVPGNHEFDFGKEVYFTRIGEAKFPLLGANLRDSLGHVLPSHQDRLSLDAHGLKLTLIGTAYEDTPSVSRPGNLTFAPTIQTVLSQAKEARAAGADLIIAIIHADKATAAYLLKTHQIDLILCGHNHDLHIDFDGRSALVESEQDANYVTIVDFELLPGRDPTQRAWWPNFRVIDTTHVDPDPAIAAKVATYQSGLDRLFDVEIATLVTPLDSRTEAVRSGESAIGNLFADALRKAGETEIAILNGGGIRGNKLYPAGTRLKKRDILDELPFGNKKVVVNITGKTLWGALENGLSQLDRPAARFPHVSGLTLIADRKQPAGSRLRQVTIDSAPFDPSRSYRLATDDFLALGGDGYGMLLGDTKMTPDSGTRLVAMDVIDYIAQAGQVEAKAEGRIDLN